MDGKTFGSYLTYENNTSTNAESNIRRRAGTLRTYSGAHAARAVAMGLFTRGDGNVGASTSGVLPSPPPLKSGGFAASGLFDAPAPRGVLTNPGWRDRVLEGTAWSFAAGLVGGAGHALYRAELDFAPHIAAVAGNVTLVGATFLCCREMTRLVRQQDDWINSATGGALAGSALATAFRGRPYSPAGALLVGGLAGGIHFAMDTDGSATMYRALGFKTVARADGTNDWVTPAWFPVRRITDDELESNEIEFQLRVDAVLEGRMTAEEADRVRAEYRRRRAAERNRREGVSGESVEDSPDDDLLPGEKPKRRGLFSRNK